MNHGYDRKGNKIIQAYFDTGNSNVDFLAKLTKMPKAKVKKTLDTERTVYGNW
jgi:hypothetical protein